MPCVLWIKLLLLLFRELHQCEYGLDVRPAIVNNFISYMRSLKFRTGKIYTKCSSIKWRNRGPLHLHLCEAIVNRAEYKNKRFGTKYKNLTFYRAMPARQKTAINYQFIHTPLHAAQESSSGRNEHSAHVQCSVLWQTKTTQCGPRGQTSMSSTESELA